MNAPSVASAVNRTTLTRPRTPATPITPRAVILNPPFFPPVAPIMSASALLTLAKTPIASRARYSTAVATIATKNSTKDTANENFITDQGSIRLTYSRARRGPREAAEETAGRALRTASATFPVPSCTARARAPAPEIGAVGDSTGAAVSRAPAGTDARPVLTLAGGDEDGATDAALSGESGGAGIPGARVNLGAGPSPLTAARPTTGRPAAAPSAESAASESAGAAEADACVSVMN